MTEGKIVSWIKSKGDTLSKDDSVVVIESDKADMDNVSSSGFRSNGAVTALHGSDELNSRVETESESQSTRQYKNDVVLTCVGNESAVSRWFNLHRPSTVGEEETEKKKEKFSSKIHLRMCLEAGYHSPQTDRNIRNYYKKSNATSFSYCLVDLDSDAISTLKFDTSLPRNAVTTPLLRNLEGDTFCYIGLKGISIGGEDLEVPNVSLEVDATGSGGIIVDSGTAVTRLWSEVYEKLREAFVRGTKGLAKAKGVSNSLFETCYDLSSRDSVEEERRWKDEERKT
ncbi:hypothetical protein Fmac_021860 [Flemingia macrophylla]|uniref:Uncharacterized protein n=1 Tax=Flemingia macrophylla TaxID=520843 RepID=A0ABD1LY50_9FABA